MSKTEQIIDAWESAPGNSDALRAAEAMAAELRRLAKLQEAYWAELQAWRGEYADATLPVEPAMRIGKRLQATDAARREAGEV